MYNFSVPHRRLRKLKTTYKWIVLIRFSSFVVGTNLMNGHTTVNPLFLQYNYFANEYILRNKMLHICSESLIESCARAIYCFQTFKKIKKIKIWINILWDWKTDDTLFKNVNWNFVQRLGLNIRTIVIETDLKGSSPVRCPVDDIRIMLYSIQYIEKYVWSKFQSGVCFFSYFPIHKMVNAVY